MKMLGQQYDPLIPLVIGTQTAATNQFTGELPLDELKSGQSIRYWLPYSGSSAGATLKLTLRNGTTTEAINVYYKGATRLTNQYSFGTMILLTYLQNVNVNGTNYTGWWCGQDGTKSGGSSGGVTSWEELEDRPFGETTIPSDTLTWDGDKTDKVTVTNTAYADGTIFVHVSDATPTLSDFQNGGSFCFAGETYEFVSEEVAESGNLVYEIYNTFFVAKEDNSRYVSGSDVDLLFPKKGFYVADLGVDGRVSELTINGYTGFSASDIQKLPFRYLPDHMHDWYGKVKRGGTTVLSDNVIHGGHVKVSDAVPTEAELRKGGVIRHYNVSDNEISGDLILGDYLGSDYTITVKDNGIVIAHGFSSLVVISYDGNPNIGGITFKGITSGPGTYLLQSKYGLVHSFTINEYTGFPTSLEKIPAELLPDNIGGGGGVSSWNDLTDKPFGETTVMGDTLTWDGNTEGLTKAGEDMFLISDVVPTMEELQNGGTFVHGGASNELTSDLIIDPSAYGIGENCIMVGSFILVALADGATLQADSAYSFEKAGVYFIKNDGGYVTSFTINGYKGFETTTIETLDVKFLPEGHQFGEIITTSDALTWDCNIDGLYSADIGGAIFACISDIVLTMDDLSDGCAITASMEEGTDTIDVPSEEITDITGDGLIVISNELFIVVPHDNYVVGSDITGDGEMIIEQKGVYVMAVLSTVASSISLKVPNCTFETTELKTIAPKYLPEYLHPAEVLTSKTLVNNIRIDLTLDGGGYVGVVAMRSILEEGSIYTVIYDGVEYSNLKAVPDADRILISSDDGSFMIYSYANFDATLFDTRNAASDATVTIINNSVTRKVINIQSLPESHQFGGEVTKTNTLTWDGVINEDDIDMTAVMGGWFFKLSDDTPTIEELSGGGTFVGGGETFVFTYYAESDGTLVAMNDEWDDPDTGMYAPWIIPEDLDLGVGTIIPKGTYTIGQGGVALCESCTFNSYEFTVGNVKCIDTKYLEPFETVEVGGNTLAWDGNTAGLYTPGNGMYLVSDAIPSYTELSAGAVVDFTGVDGRTSLAQTTSDIIDRTDDLGYMTMLSLTIVIITRAGAVDTFGTVYEKTGVYFSKKPVSNASGSYTLQIHSLTIDGYAGFTEEQIKLKEEYLPASASGDGTLQWNDIVGVPVATATTPGMMSPEDKAKLDSLLSVEGVGF